MARSAQAVTQRARVKNSARPMAVSTSAMLVERMTVRLTNLFSASACPAAGCTSCFITLYPRYS